MLKKGKNIAIVLSIIVFLFGFSLWGICKPDNAISESERRVLAQFPTLNRSSVLSGKFMTDFDSYALDQFPLRDQFRTLKGITAFYILGQKDNNGIYIENGYVSKLEYPMNIDSIEYAAKRFRFLYEKYLADRNMPVYLSIIPDKNYFLSRENGYPSIDYEIFLSEVTDRMDFAEYIDIAHLLELSDYYRTDTHWRQEKIEKVARYLTSKMGISLSDEYTQKHVETPFYGVYYGQSALPLPADELCYLDNANLNQCKIYDYEMDSYISFYDLEKAEGNDPYELFLSGPKSLLIIENPKAVSDKELIIFRDSFGSSLAPLLAEGFAKITLVDIRYLSPNMLGRFIDFDNQYVLFLYSTTVLNNSITIK
ncbi:MAG: hypothetical protein K2N51_20750 [Lachnospiraceae bacterium]|nr:hypothetical protein [Lachnospiraceae bacterium]